MAKTRLSIGLGLFGCLLLAGCTGRVAERTNDTPPALPTDDPALTGGVNDPSHPGAGPTDTAGANTPAGIDDSSLDPLAVQPGDDPDPWRMLGRPMDDWEVAEWKNSKPMSLQDLRGRVVFVHFWSNEGESASHTLPAIQQLSDEFDGKPVTFVGLYHSKGTVLDRPWQEAVDEAAKYGVAFPIAYDRQWKTISNWWLDYFRYVPTEASFVIDPEGKLAYVHPGPEFHLSDDPLYRQATRDYLTIRAAIQKSLPLETADGGKSG